MAAVSSCAAPAMCGETEEVHLHRTQCRKVLRMRRKREKTMQLREVALSLVVVVVVVVVSIHRGENANMSAPASPSGLARPNL